VTRSPTGPSSFSVKLLRYAASSIEPFDKADRSSRVFDFATGYKAIPIPDAVLAMNPLPVKELRERGQLLSDKNWLLRIILLESIAGVPGMVGGTLRHLRSLRLLVSLNVTTGGIELMQVETGRRMDSHSARRG